MRGKRGKAAKAAHEARIAELPNRKNLCTVKEAAKLVGRPPSAIHNWFTRGRLNTEYKIDNVTYLSRKSVVAVDAAMRKATAKAA